jgi:hypothetical protein
LAHGFEFLQDTSPGAAVQYVPPSGFDEAYQHLTAYLQGLKGLRAESKLFIDGARGCGKTRFGWELGRKLMADNELGLDTAHYICLKLADLPDNLTDVSKASEALAQVLVTTGLGIKYQQVRVQECTLADVVPYLARCGDMTKRKAALVLHIDEFQGDPFLTVLLLRAIRQFNELGEDVKIGGKTVTKILPVCTGLFAPDTEVLMAKYMSDLPCTVSLHYLTPDDAWEVVRNAFDAKRQANSRTDGHLPADINDAPAALRYLVEDTLGWALVAVQIGALLAIHIDHISELHDLTAAYLERVETAIDEYLWAHYPPHSFRNAFGTGIEGLQKLLVLAMSPHSVCCSHARPTSISRLLRPSIPTPFPQVPLSEPINGSTLQDIRKHGLIDLPSRGQDVLVRMNKPLLRILLRDMKLLEKMLLRRDTIPPGYLPGDMQLLDVLQTCRVYNDDLLEVVQLVSLHVSYFSWLLLDPQRRPAPTFLGLRPGAASFDTQESLQFMVEGAEKVDNSPYFARGATALACIPRLAKRGSATGEAAFTAEGNEAVDSSTFSSAYQLQAKGQTAGPAAGNAGGDADLQPGAVYKIFKAMVSKTANDAPTPIGYELLSTKNPSPSLRGMVQGVTNSSPKASTDGLQKLATLGGCKLLLTREMLRDAMGPIFGGIAARCTEPKKK